MFKKMSLSIAFIFLIEYCSAHGFAGNGLLHPLTGLDHVLAMIAVGAWSAQLGGKAIFLVPCSFLIMMILGGIPGVEIISIDKIEWLIALSIILLGMAISINKKISTLIAGLAVGIFGFSHGYVHGTEIPHTINVYGYIIGFTITTLGLHVIGAVGGLLILEEQNGRKQLRVLGAITLLIGLYLLPR